MTTPLSPSKVHFVFPLEGEPLDVVTILELRDVLLLLDRMESAAYPLDRQDYPDAHLYRRPFNIVYAIRARRDVKDFGQALDHAGAADPFMVGDVVPLALRDVRMFVEGAMVYLDMRIKGKRFDSFEVLVGQIMKARIALESEAKIPEAFRHLAAVDPSTALDLLEHGVVLRGATAPVRLIRPMLTRQDLQPLLSFPDSDVWERAVAALALW